MIETPTTTHPGPPLRTAGEASTVGSLNPGATGGSSAKRLTANAWASLVLSSDTGRLTRLTDINRDAGWEPIACASPADAMRLAQRWRTQLATIDLSGVASGRRETHRQLASQLVTHDRLVVVCDDAATPEGELWARQAGVWLYLPEAELNQGLTDIFRDAISIAEKLATAG